MAHNPVYVQPDPVHAVIEYLRGLSEITALLPAEKIVSSIPAKGTAYPYVLVNFAGGADLTVGMEESTVQIDSVGGSKPQCQKIARTIRAAVIAIANDIVTDGVLAHGSTELAPQWLPDEVPTPPLSRYTARYSVILHP
jgi:hypothetical protein